MPRVFISYRREDTKWEVGRIYDRLVGAFGSDNIFKDVDSIPMGADFRKVLDSAVSQCDVLLVVIGERWLKKSGWRRRRRIDSPDDLVRIEVESGLQRGLLVVPLLVGTARIPAESDLPPTLQDLASRHAARVRPDPDFHTDMDRIVGGLEKSMPTVTPPRTVSSSPPRSGAIPPANPAPAPPPRSTPQAPQPKRKSGGQVPAWTLAGAWKRLVSRQQSADSTAWFWSIAACVVLLVGVALWKTMLEPGWFGAMPSAANEHPVDSIGEAPMPISPTPEPATAVARTPISSKPEPSTTTLIPRNPETIPTPIAVNSDPSTPTPSTPAPSGIRPPVPFDATFRRSATEAQAAQQAWAKHVGVKVVESNSIGMDLVLIPPGKFKMGSPDSESDAFHNEKPQVDVTLSRPLYVGKTEVTQGQWQAVMKPTPWIGRANVKEGAEYAATYVSHDDAVEFCRKLSQEEGTTYRLLTEAEWEYVCRAGTTTKYHCGDALLGTFAWFDKNAGDVGEKYAHEVAKKQPNPFGLHDMHGNVWEWCEDWYGEELPGGVDPTRSSESATEHYLLRGGSWFVTAESGRSALRSRHPPLARFDNLGFRVARILLSE